MNPTERAPRESSGQVHLIGGEMEMWSDPVPERSPAFEQLIREVLPATGRLLIAGMHPWSVIDVARSAAERTTLLVRGQRDAEEAAARCPDLTVWCGDLERVGTDHLGSDGPFDAVVALGGVEILNSADAPLRTWQDNADTLLSWLTADACLVLGVQNALGIPTLARAREREADDRDSAWLPTLGFDRTRPASAPAVARVAGPRATSARTWAVYPSNEAPSLVFAADEPVLAGTALTALIERHSERLDGQLRIEPRALARRAVQAGQAVDLAPAWVLSIGGAAATRGALVSDGPDVIVIDETSLGRTGDLLDARLLAMCGAHDLPGIRDLLRGYADWLSTARQDLDRHMSNVLVDGSSFAVLDPRPASPPTPAADVLLRSIDRFARRLTNLGWQHPWPLVAGPDEIATAMAASLELEVTAWDLERVRRDSPVTPPDELDASTLTADGIRGLRTRNAALQGRIDWFEAALRDQDTKLATQVARTEELRDKLKHARTDIKLARDELERSEARVARITRSRAYRLVRRTSNFLHRLRRHIRLGQGAPGGKSRSD